MLIDLEALHVDFWALCAVCRAPCVEIGTPCATSMALCADRGVVCRACQLCGSVNLLIRVRERKAELVHDTADTVKSK